MQGFPPQYGEMDLRTVVPFHGLGLYPHLLPKIDGLDVCILNTKSVGDPDNHPELLWADEDWDFDRWYSSA